MSRQAFCLAWAMEHIFAEVFEARVFGAEIFEKGLHVMKLSRMGIGLGVVVALLASTIEVQAIWQPFSPPWKGQSRPVDVDLTQPDALIDSESLSSLPRDMLRVPLLHDVLTQDFVTYYENNEGRLSVAGAVRRIAFEHDLDWSDTLLRRVFDEPARVLLWRGPDGALRYWALAMERNGLAKILQTLASIAPGDAQLAKAGEIDGAPLYAWRIGPTRTVLLVGKGDRLVALSDPGMLLDAEGGVIETRGAVVTGLLSQDAGARAAALKAFAPDTDPIPADPIPADPLPAGHRVVVGADYLSFGYQTFFPAIKALRFDFAGDAGVTKDWRTAALLDGAALPQRWDSAALWQALPTAPAACATLPIDWSSISAALPEIGDAFDGPAAVCWYGKSSLVTPLFAARIRSAEAATALRPVLATLFARMIGSHEPKANGESGLYTRLPVQEDETQENENATVRWMRPVSSPYGVRTAKDSGFADRLSAKRYFPVTLALTRQTVLFSPDATLIDDALAVQAKRYPAVADGMPSGMAARTVLTITPSSLASLVRQEALAALPPDQEALFLNAARVHLLPKLKALGTYPTLSLVLPDSLPAKSGWVTVEWRQDAASPMAEEPEPAEEAPITEPFANDPSTDGAKK